jgi:hypothetical protein
MDNAQAKVGCRWDITIGILRASLATFATGSRSWHWSGRLYTLTFAFASFGRGGCTRLGSRLASLTTLTTRRNPDQRHCAQSHHRPQAWLKLDHFWRAPEFPFSLRCD